MEHIVPVVLFLILGIVFIRLGLHRWTDDQKWRRPFWWSLLLPFSIVIWIAFRVARGEFDINDDLPFHMCNLITFSLPFVFLQKRQTLFGVMYFWVMAGTLQAVFTPGLEQSFPHFWYFRYWLIHCGLVVFILYGILVLHYRPTLKHILYAFLAMNALMLVGHLFNLWAGTNYLYTMNKPNQASLLDYMGPWPVYIFVGEFIALFFFFLYYLPFLYLEKQYRRSSLDEV